MCYQTINPATGEIAKTFSQISDAKLEKAVGHAQTCYEDDWRYRSVAHRARVVSAAAAKLRQNADEYAHYVTLEMGKLIGTEQAEVALSAKILDYYAQNAEAF